MPLAASPHTARPLLLPWLSLRPFTVHHDGPAPRCWLGARPRLPGPPPARLGRHRSAPWDARPVGSPAPSSPHRCRRRAAVCRVLAMQVQPGGHLPRAEAGVGALVWWRHLQDRGIKHPPVSSGYEVALSGARCALLETTQQPLPCDVICGLQFDCSASQLDCVEERGRCCHPGCRWRMRCGA